MPKLEWVFLDLVVEGYVSLNMVWGSAYWFKEQWNLPWYGLTREETESVLRGLHSRQLIEWLDWDEDGKRNVVPNIADAQLTRSKLAYGLTAAGGAAWEEIACPDWTNFLDYEVTYLQDYPVSITISGAAERRLGLASIAWAFDEGCFPDFSRCSMKCVRPFTPTYWKELEVGYSFNFEVKKVQSEFGNWTQSLEDYSWAFDWTVVRPAKWYDRHELWKGAIAAHRA